MNPINNGKFNLLSMQFLQFNVVSFGGIITSLNVLYSQAFPRTIFSKRSWDSSAQWTNTLCAVRTKAIDHVIVMLMLFMCSVYSIEVSNVVQWKMERGIRQPNRMLLYSTWMPFSPSPARQIFNNLCVKVQCNTIRFLAHYAEQMWANTFIEK